MPEKRQFPDFQLIRISILVDFLNEKILTLCPRSTHTHTPTHRGQVFLLSAFIQVKPIIITIIKSTKN